MYRTSTSMNPQDIIGYMGVSKDGTGVCAEELSGRRFALVLSSASEFEPDGWLPLPLCASAVCDLVFNQCETLLMDTVSFNHYVDAVQALKEAKVPGSESIPPIFKVASDCKHDRHLVKFCSSEEEVMTLARNLQSESSNTVVTSTSKPSSKP